MHQTEIIKKKVAGLPHDPGVYIMKAEDGSIIYIGKASSLKKRVSSYFSKKDHDPKTKVLVKNIRDFEYIITDSEIEALLLESNLIKKHKPRFNIRLKDDKRYPYIAVTLGDDYPRVIYTRKINNRKNKYFGPYTDARAAKKTVEMINSVFKLKTCTRDIPLKKNERPCLNYQIKKCSGICQGIISRDEYLELVKNAVKFLEGNVGPVLENLKRMMDVHAGNMEYEKAASFRDIIYDIQTVSQDQKITLPAGLDRDYIGASVRGEEGIVILFEFRKGMMLGRKISVFEHGGYAYPSEIIRTFITEYYLRSEIPSGIFTSEKIDDREILEKYLTEKSARKIKISTAESREDRGITMMIQKNIDMLFIEREAGRTETKIIKGLQDIMDVLKLDNIPEHMECFDISNFQGTDSVASMVRFQNGLPDKKNYRRYKIRGYDQANDPGMIHEVVGRRIQHLVNENESLPDLMIIDGGPTQLTRAIEAASNFDVNIRIVSLAKRLEEIFIDPKKKPVLLSEDSPALHIFQNIRDEAHRFAITYHRKLRKKRTLTSELDNIPGIGENTRNLLLKEMGSVDKIRNSTIGEISAVEGIGIKTAEIILNYFQSNK